MNQTYRKSEKKDLELYLHIPFCVRKCAYCDFLSAPAGPGEIEQYVRCLQDEIRQFAQRQEPYLREHRVVTVFLGGGTPSLLPGRAVKELMERIQDCFLFAADAEISMECNPGTASMGKLAAFRQAGINRISFGLQSADNRELELLGRIHTWEDFRETYENARNVGFDNINIDLMSALPGQTAASWRRTLAQVLALRPEHISAYSLMIEEGTPFFERYREDARIREKGGVPKLLPSEEEERLMYRLTEDLLGEAGFHRYEISNYARTGCECRHNMGYWEGTDYIGFGLGAASLQNHVRFHKTDDLSRYLAGDFDEKDREELTEEGQMEEFMFLGLRLMAGVSEHEFDVRFGRSVDEVYGDVLARQQQLGLLKRQEGRIFLSERGIDLSNAVMAEFLL